MGVDPEVYALASRFVDRILIARPSLAADLIAHAGDLRERLANAMQQAIEQECEAIEQELDR